MAGTYGQLLNYPDWIETLIAELEKVGSFSTGIENVGSRSRGGFHAINTDIYDYDEAQGLAVIQVRESFKRKASHFLRVRKNYFLIGRNENGNVFAHPIPTPRTSTMDAVIFAQSKIWRCTEKQLARVVRNGDVAFVPVSRRPSDL